MSGLTHIDKDGKAVMVDVSDKDESERIAVAKGRVRMQPETLALIRDGGVKKGDVLSVARLAGIRRSSETSEYQYDERAHGYSRFKTLLPPDSRALRMRSKAPAPFWYSPPTESMRRGTGWGGRR